MSLSRHVTISNVNKFTGLDEDMMRRMYNRLKYGFRLNTGWVLIKQPKQYRELVIIGDDYKDNSTRYRERQSLLALEQLGKVKHLGNEFWQTTDYVLSEVNTKVKEDEEYDYNG